MLKIKNIILNQNFKAVLNYCLRVLLFLLLSRDFIFEYTAEFLIPILGNFISSLDSDPFVSVGLFAVVCILVHDYFFAKVCGLFKKLDKINIFFAILIILLIDIIRSYSFGISVQLSPFLVSYNKPNFIFMLIFAFIIYRFLNLLTKIFPMPFKKIGYIFSIELIKDIYKNIKSKINT